MIAYRLVTLLLLVLSLAGCNLKSGNQGSLEGVPIWGGDRASPHAGSSTTVTTAGDPAASMASRGPGSVTLEGVPIWGTADTAFGGDESNIGVTMFWPQITQTPTELSVMITSPNPRLTKQVIENEYIAHTLPIRYPVDAMTTQVRLVIRTRAGAPSAGLQPEVFDVTISNAAGSCKTVLNWSNPALPKTNPNP